MYQHILFDNDAYYFNGNWAMKYMENYGWRKHTKKEKKQRLDKWNNLEYLNKEYGNDKKFDADCLEIMREFENKVCLIGSNCLFSKEKLESCKKLLFCLGVGKLKPAVCDTIFFPALNKTSSSLTITSEVPLPNKELSPGSG